MLAQTPVTLEILGAGTANPFVTKWEPTKLNLKGINPVYQAGPIRGYGWFHLSAWPVGEKYFPPPAPGVTFSRAELAKLARSGDNRFSFLKLEVTYSPSNGIQPRCMKFDIGAGLDVFIPPTTMLEARLLVPTEFQEFVPASLTEADFATIIAVNARCVPAPVGRRMGTYTVCRYLTDSPQSSAIVEFECGAKSIQVFSDGVMTSAEDWFFGWQRPPLPDVAPSGSVPSSTDRPNVIPSSAIPGTSNVFVAAPDIIPAAGQIVCVVQELEW